MEKIIRIGINWKALNEESGITYVSDISAMKKIRNEYDEKKSYLQQSIGIARFIALKKNVSA
jgi:hypothetical protein